MIAKKEVTQMMSNCNYIKTKLMYKLMKIEHMIEQHAIKDAESDGHPLCANAYKELQQDLQKHVEKLRQAVEGLSREGKFR